MSAFSIIRHAPVRPPSTGHCPVCRKATFFVAFGSWLREDLKCARCKSSARERAVVGYILDKFPRLSRMSVYEPSPVRRIRRFFERCAADYTWSCHPAGQSAGHDEQGGSFQDLESLTFRNQSFDLVVTQDVFEHVANPAAAFAEVARVLAPGGSHVFTIPWYPDQPTQRRAELVDGQIVHLAPPEYHGDPFDENGALVFNRFGADLTELVAKASGMRTTITEAIDKRKGIRGDSLFVFHSVKQ